MIGSNPIVIPIFSNIWNKNTPAIPIATYDPSSSLAVLAIYTILVIINTYNIIISDLDDSFFEDTFDSSPQDRFYYETLKRIISSIAFSNNSNDNNSGTNKENCKILKLNIKKEID